MNIIFNIHGYRIIDESLLYVLHHASSVLSRYIDLCAVFLRLPNRYCVTSQIALE